MITTTSQKRTRYKPMRDHDYLFDSTFTVAGEKDHNKIIYNTAMATAQMTIVPIYNHMFSDLRTCPNVTRAYIPNAYLPAHVDLSYSGRFGRTYSLSSALISGKERFRFYTTPKITGPVTSLDQPLKAISQSSPEQISPRGMLVDKCVQTFYRESNTQTEPYQPEYKIRDDCENSPEVLILENVEIDQDFMKMGIDKTMVLWVNRQKAKKAWLQTEPTTSILGQLEYYEQRCREKDIEDFLEKFELVDAISVLDKVDNRKSARIWNSRLEKMKKNIEKIRMQKERDLRKLETRKSARNLIENNQVYKCFVPERSIFISINSTFLPTIEKLEDKLTTFQNAKSATLCSKIKNFDLDKLKNFQEKISVQ